MRGSPLIRTILVFLALVVSGVGFVRLTDRGTAVPDWQVGDGPEISDSSKIPAKVRLILSRPAGFFDLKISGQTVALKRGGSFQLAEKSWEFSGETMIDPKHLIVLLKVACVPPASGDTAPVFAKLVVEADGKETFTHVFDAPDDIDDFVELPF